MATNTTNLSLIKPAGTDKIRIAQINQNMDIIDEKMGAVGSTSLQTQVTNLSNSLKVGGDPLTDANTAKTTGIYYIGTSTLNRPETYCLLYVYAAASNTTLVQLAIGLFSHKMSVRAYANGSWSSWDTCPVNINDIRKFSRAATISWGTSDTVNLNNIITSGIYYCNGASPSNLPWTASSGVYFHMEVFGLSDNTIVQKITTLGGDGIYVRGYFNSTWQSWQKIALNSQVAKILKTKTITPTSDSNSTIDLSLSNSYIVYSVYLPDMTNVAAIPYLHNNAWRARLIHAETGAALSAASRNVTVAYIEL